MRGSSLGVLLLLGLTPGALTLAQQPDAASAPAQVRELQAAVGRLQAGVHVRVATAGARVEGPYVRSAAGLLELSGAQPVVLARVDSLWVRGPSTRRGALVGALVAGAGLATYGALFFSENCDVDCQHAGLEGAALGLGLGAIAGALLGGTVGSLIPRWQRRHP